MGPVRGAPGARDGDSRDRRFDHGRRLTRRGGTLVLVSDVVSTTTAPELAGTPPGQLEAEMAQLVAARNFFTGTNPYCLVGLLEDDPRFSNLVADVRLVDPWLWPVTADRRHLTYAIVAHRV